MDSAIITDCQISATTFFNSSTVPWNARPTSENFWSPIIDLDIEHALEINFMRRTKVTSIQLISVLDYERISACSVYAYANDDTEWTLLKKFDSIDYDKRGRSKGLIIMGDADSEIGRSENAVGAKFVSRIKIVIHNVTNFKDGGSRDGDAKHGDAKHGDAKHGDAKHGDAKHGDAKGLPITDAKKLPRGLVAVKLELFGCYLEPSKTLTQKAASFDVGVPRADCVLSNESNPGREFSMNAKQNMALICDVYGSLR